MSPNHTEIGCRVKKLGCHFYMIDSLAFDTKEYIHNSNSFYNLHSNSTSIEQEEEMSTTPKTDYKEYTVPVNDGITEEDTQAEYNERLNPHPSQLSRSFSRSYRRSRSRSIRLSQKNANLPPEQRQSVTDPADFVLKPSKILYFTVINGLVGAFQFGWMLSQLNFRVFDTADSCNVVPVVDHTCVVFPGHTRNEWLMAVTSWIAGGCIGAVVSGIPADKIGRKQTLIYNMFVMMIGALVQSVSNSIYLFSVGRLISGIASGATINVVNILISEISPPTLRGTLTTGLQVFVALGSLFVTTCHYFVGSSSYGWRLLVGFPIILGAFQLLTSHFTTQSPMWLISNGKKDKAATEMSRLYIHCPVEEIVQDMANVIEEDRAERVRSGATNAWAQLFSAKYRAQLIIALVLCAAQQLCGIDAIFYYSSNIFYSAGITDPRIGNTIINLVRTSQIIVAAYIMDKYPRRTLLMSGLTVMVISSACEVLSLALKSPVLSLVATAIYVGSFCLSIGPMAWMVSAEIFPDFLHANAGSVGTLATWASNLTVGLAYPSIVDGMGNYAFTVFAVLNLFFVLFVRFRVPETANKSIEDIQKVFQKNSTSTATETA